MRNGSGERLVYIRPDGVKYPLHAPPTRAVIAEEGLGTPPMDYTVDRAPFQHGDTVRAVTLNPRAVQLTIIQNFCSRAEYRAGRALLLDTIRPNRAGQVGGGGTFDVPGSLLYYLAGRVKRQLDCLLDSGPGFAPPAGGWREWSFTEVLRFIAHDPVWYDPTQNTVVFADAFAVLPMVLPAPLVGFGVIGPVVYAGTWLEQPSFVINGPIANPSILNSTIGAKIELTATIPAGRYVTYTLRGTKAIVRDDGLNLLNTLTPDSDLTSFGLAPEPVAIGGVNAITISGSATTTATYAYMQWYSRYFGI